MPYGGQRINNNWEACDDFVYRSIQNYQRTREIVNGLTQTLNKP